MFIIFFGLFSPSSGHSLNDQGVKICAQSLGLKKQANMKTNIHRAGMCCVDRVLNPVSIVSLSDYVLVSVSANCNTLVLCLF